MLKGECEVKSEARVTVDHHHRKFVTTPRGLSFVDQSFEDISLPTRKSRGKEPVFQRVAAKNAPGGTVLNLTQQLYNSAFPTAAEMSGS